MEKKIKVIFEDEEVMVIDKPAGLVVTNEGKEVKESLENWLKKRYQISDIRCQLERGGIVHRLDKGTSGLLLVAKTKRAWEDLKRQFKDREVKKKYLAMICGDVPFEGEINVPIARSKFGFAKFGVVPEGKKSLTIFRLISKYQYEGKKYSLLEIDLKTGRTHQIRVHFSYLKWPLLGDKLYGGEILDGFSRPFLHAAEIVFRHPVSGKMMLLKSELAEDLQEIVRKFPPKADKYQVK